MSDQRPGRITPEELARWKKYPNGYANPSTVTRLADEVWRLREELAEGRRALRRRDEDWHERFSRMSESARILHGRISDLEVSP